MLNDLYDMKIDAMQALNKMVGDAAIQSFKNAMYIPDKKIIDRLLDGETYYLVGNKGSGKTALLIYTALLAEEKFNAERNFIVFKEFSQEEREDYKKLAHVTSYDKNEISKYFDYTLVWNWLFHLSIVEAIDNSEKKIFEKNEDYDIYYAAVKAVKTNYRGQGRKMPIILNDGFIESSVDIPIAGVRLNGKLNFEFNNTNKNQIKFSSYVENLNMLYSRLIDSDSQLYICVDEMNLSNKNKEEFVRDIHMIRDLIIAIERFNAINPLSLCARKNVRVIGAVRTEVIDSVYARGQEVNKSIESYGYSIDWSDFLDGGIKHPLIKLLINYFRLSDRFNSKTDDKKLYDYWVKPEINGLPSADFIRENTLYRPRDIVRILNLLRNKCGDRKQISTETFNAIKRSYSKACWHEVVEELIIYYTYEELEYIKAWLTGIPQIMDYEEMRQRALKNWSDNELCVSLINNFDELMRRLYKVGIIGNYNKVSDEITSRWYFKGDNVLLTKQKIKIHDIFCTELSIDR